MLYQFQSERKTRRSRGPVAGRCGTKVMVKVEDGIGKCWSMANQYFNGSDSMDVSDSSCDGKGKEEVKYSHRGGVPILRSMRKSNITQGTSTNNSNHFHSCAGELSSKNYHPTASIVKDADIAGEDGADVAGSGNYEGDFNSLFSVPRSQLVGATHGDSLGKTKSGKKETHKFKNDYLIAPKIFLPSNPSLDYHPYCYSNDYYEVSLVSDMHSSLTDDLEHPLSTQSLLKKDCEVVGFNEEDYETDHTGSCCVKSESIFSRNTSFDSTLSSQYFANSESSYSNIGSPNSIDSDMVDSLYDLPTYTYESSPIFKRSQQNFHLQNEQQHENQHQHHHNLLLPSHHHRHHHALQGDDEINKHKLLSTSFSLSPTPIASIQENEDHLFGLKLEVPSLVSFTNSNQIQSYVCTLENTIDDENNLSDSIFPSKSLSFEPEHEHTLEHKHDQGYDDIATQLDGDATYVKTEEAEKTAEEGGDICSGEKCVKYNRGIKNNIGGLPEQDEPAVLTKVGIHGPGFSFSQKKKITSREINNSGEPCHCVGEDADLCEEDGDAVGGGCVRARGKLEMFTGLEGSRKGRGGGSGVKKGNAVPSGSKVEKISKKGKKNRVRRARTRSRIDAELEAEVQGADEIGLTEAAYGDSVPKPSLKVVTATASTAAATSGKTGRRNKRRKQPTVFICKHCGKDFPRKSNHDSHIRLHLTVKPHVCQFCSKAFVRRSDMNRHERSLHLKTTFKCFGKCNRQKWGCGHLYSRKDGLRKHWKSVQGQECLREFMVLNNLTEQYHEVKDLEKIIELTNLF